MKVPEPESGMPVTVYTCVESVVAEENCQLVRMGAGADGVAPNVIGRELLSILPNPPVPASPYSTVYVPGSGRYTLPLTDPVTVTDEILRLICI